MSQRIRASSICTQLVHFTSDLKEWDELFLLEDDEEERDSKHKSTAKDTIETEGAHSDSGPSHAGSGRGLLVPLPSQSAHQAEHDDRTEQSYHSEADCIQQRVEFLLALPPEIR